MNQQDSLDLLSEIEIPPWMMQNINELEDPSGFLQSDEPMNLNGSGQNSQNSGSVKGDYRKGESMVSYGLNSYSSKKSSESSSQEEQDRKSYEKTSLITKKESKNKQQRRNQTSRKYRQRKKQYTKNLEKQNSFLKFKVDELTFRLHEVTTELNKMKNNSIQQNVPNYHQLKSERLQQVENALENRLEDESKYEEIQKRLSTVIAFDGKQKIDLLNYFMSELMQNVITDKCFYMIDCLLNKKGVHRPNESVRLSQLDVEVFDILELWDSKKHAKIKQLAWGEVVVECKRFQECWKKLYQVYLAILNQGFKLERLMDKFRAKLKDILTVRNMLSVELYFEKNKYRSDIREMRSLWFRELERENSAREMVGRHINQGMKLIE